MSLIEFCRYVWSMAHHDDFKREFMHVDFPYMMCVLMHLYKLILVNIY